MEKKFYVFDLDGVLIDSKKNMSLSWKQVREKIGVKQKFMIYNTKRTINYDTNVISFYNNIFHHNIFKLFLIINQGKSENCE